MHYPPKWLTYYSNTVQSLHSKPTRESLLIKMQQLLSQVVSTTLSHSRKTALMPKPRTWQILKGVYLFLMTVSRECLSSLKRVSLGSLCLTMKFNKLMLITWLTELMSKVLINSIYFHFNKILSLLPETGTVLYQMGSHSHQKGLNYRNHL